MNALGLDLSAICHFISLSESPALFPVTAEAICSIEVMSVVVKALCFIISYCSWCDGASTCS